MVYSEISPLGSLVGPSLVLELLSLDRERERQRETSHRVFTYLLRCFGDRPVDPNKATNTTESTVTTHEAWNPQKRFSPLSLGSHICQTKTIGIAITK